MNRALDSTRVGQPGPLPKGPPETEAGRLCLVAAVTAIGYAILDANGTYSQIAIRWISVGFALALLPAVIPHVPRVERFLARYVRVPAFALAVGFSLAELASHPPGMYLRNLPNSPTTDFHFWLTPLALACGLALARAPRHPRLASVAILTCYLVLGFWLLEASPRPRIDVFSIHQDSARALLDGQNPYALTHRNIYGTAVWYAPGAATPDRLNFGYVYPSWNLLVATLGYIWAPDYRYAFLVLCALSGWLMANAGPRRWASLALALFVVNPRSLFVLEQGWTEPALLIGIALAVWATQHQRWNWLALGLGLVLCAKQYSVVAAPAVLLLRPQMPSWRAYAVLLGRAVAIAALLTLPFVLWDVQAYWHGVYGIQFGAPLRTDSLSFPVAWLAQFGKPMPFWLQLGAPLGLSVLVLARAPRNAFGLAWAGASMYFAFFLFRQGFCNYFFLVIGALCLAIAAVRAPHGNGACPQDEQACAAATPTVPGRDSAEITRPD